MPNIREIANFINCQLGLDPIKCSSSVKVNPQKSKVIASIYHYSSSFDIKSIPAYKVFIKEINLQYQVCKDSGITFNIDKGNDKYKNSVEMTKDIIENNHLWVFDG